MNVVFAIVLSLVLQQEAAGENAITRYSVARNMTLWMDGEMVPEKNHFQTTIRNEILVSGNRFNETAKFVRLKNGRVEATTINHRVSDGASRWSWSISSRTPPKIPVSKSVADYFPNMDQLLADPLLVTGDSRLFSQQRPRDLELENREFDPAVSGFAHLECIRPDGDLIAEIRLLDSERKPVSIITWNDPDGKYPIEILRTDFRVLNEQKQKRLVKATVKRDENVAIKRELFRLPLSEGTYTLRENRFKASDPVAQDKN